MPQVIHATATLPANPWLLNCKNGTIDLRSGDLLTDHPEQDHNLAPVDYDPAATCPRWDAFLDRIFAGDAELIEFVQRSVGLSLVGTAKTSPVLYVLRGTGANGKSTFLNVILNLLGDYGHIADLDHLLHRGTYMAQLHRFRFVSIAEDPHRILFDPDIFASIPSTTLWLATNDQPVVRKGGRLRLIPFSVAIPPEEQDHNLAESLRTEYPGILAWAVRGCLAWRRSGLKTVSVATPAGTVL